jgi:hypothetical protein
MAVVDLPVVHIFSTQTVAKFYRRRPKVNLDMVAIAYWSGEAAPAAVGRKMANRSPPSLFSGEDNLASNKAGAFLL